MMLMHERHDPVLQATSATLPVLHISSVPRENEPRRFLIDRLWSSEAVGILGGAPKSCKSWLGLDMALSVASGSAALGHFPVEDPGLALVYLAEDALPLVRERVESIARAREIELLDTDLHVISVSSLRLDRREDLERLRATLSELRPRLLLLDPLVRLHSIDENSASEIARLLGALREMQRDFHVAILLVHHIRKSASAHGGQALRGSGDLHAFGDSNLYLRRTRDGLVLTIEHRSAAAPEPVLLTLDDRDPERVHLRVSHTPAHAPEEQGSRKLEHEIERLLEEREPRTRRELREALAVKNERLGAALESLEHEQAIKRTASGWRRVRTSE